MASRLAKGFAFFAITAALSACAHPGAPAAPRPVTPENGPKGTLSVDVFGGEFARQIQPRFRLDRAGYVMVGHLGGDGQIRVLYPETPQKSGWVSGNKTIRLKPTAAVWDAAPNLFSFATAPIRSFSAQMDSYDGMGHGFVFLITSRYPIDYEALMGASGYEELAVEDYEATRDPRYAVRSFADDLTTGPYTLKFARNSHGSLYANATRCSSNWGLFSYYGGLSYYPWMDLGYSYFSYPGASLMNSVAWASMYGLSRCRGGNYYAMHLPRYGYGGRTVFIPVTGTPSGPITPQLQRPTRRTFEEGQRTRILTGRSPIDRITDRSGETLAHRRPTGGQGRERIGRFGGGERTIDRSDRPREIERSRPASTEISRGRESASRPTETPRMTTPSAPPQTTTTTTSTGGETRAERPRPQP
jgi:hypothetical protein